MADFPHFDALPEELSIPVSEPGRGVAGRVKAPPSKSVSHRYLALTWLANAGDDPAVSSWPRRVESLLDAEDIQLFLGVLRAAGWGVETSTRPDHDSLDAELTPPPAPVGAQDHATETTDLFCGNAGTLCRLLTGILTALPGHWRLDGTQRLRERPVGPLLDALAPLGARVRCLGDSGHPPLDIEGGSLTGGPTRLDAGQSSQYLSALLLAGLRAPAALDVTVTALASSPYLDLTLDAARHFAGRIEHSKTAQGFDHFHVQPGLAFPSEPLRVEGDFSAACYPAAAAALGGEVAIEGVLRGSRQGDRGFFDLLERMGAEVTWGKDGVTVHGSGRLRAVDTDLGSMPDQVPTLAALAPFAQGTTHIRNVAHLRIKESDRLRAMATELRRLGAVVEELEDGLVIPGVWASGVPEDTRESIAVDTWDDHRIAMSLALVGLRRGGVVVRQPRVVAKSYPGFWRDLGGLLS